MAVKNSKQDIRRRHFVRKLSTLETLNGSEIIKLNAVDPEKIIGVKSNRIYAQIAKTGRDPGLYKNRQQLIKIIKAAKKSRGLNKTIKFLPEPAYILMTVKDVTSCFGKDLRKMPETSFIDIKDTKKLIENESVCNYIIEE